jgi:hypothetical protein
LVVSVAGAGLLVAGVITMDTRIGSPLLAGGIAGVFVAAALVIIARMVSIAGASAADLPRGATPEVTAALSRVEHLLVESRDLLFLSPAARRAVYGDREPMILQQLIESMIAGGRAEDASQLCDALAVGGLTEEAARGREIVARWRASTELSEAQSLLAAFDAALARRDWATAYGEAARIRAMNTEAPIVAEIDARIAHAREDHKRDLEARLLDASTRDDVDGAMAALRELDRYMTREEASRLSGAAQQIIARHRERLGVVFRLAVQERRWPDAARAGNAIIAEYPNTKMADEVRSMIDLIRTRASQAAVVAQAS